MSVEVSMEASMEQRWSDISCNSSIVVGMRLPRLSDDDRDLLELHHGCKKCRRCYVQHTNANCPNDFPDARTYRPLSQSLAAEAYKASQQPGYDAFHGVAPSMDHTAMVARVFAWGGPASPNPLRQPHRRPPPHPFDRTPDPHPFTQTPIEHTNVPHSEHKSFYIPHEKRDKDFFRSFSYPAHNPNNRRSPVPGTMTTPAHIEETLPENPMSTLPTAPQAIAAAAAVVPSIVNHNGGLTPETDSSSSDVSPSAFPHIIWTASAFGLSEFPDTVDCLMDTGANLILIRPETVANLGLTAR
jgi:hypothetical protein